MNKDSSVRYGDREFTSEKLGQCQSQEEYAKMICIYFSSPWVPGSSSQGVARVCESESLHRSLWASVTWARTQYPSLLLGLQSDLYSELHKAVGEVAVTKKSAACGLLN